MTNIYTWRKNADLTQNEMSIKMEIPKRTIEAWEEGKRNPPKYVEKLVIEKLKQITEKTIMEKAKKRMNKMPSDENGERPIGKWAIITSNIEKGGMDEWIDLFDNMESAIKGYEGKGHIAYITVNKEFEGFYEDKNGRIWSDYDNIEL